MCFTHIFNLIINEYISKADPFNPSFPISSYKLEYLFLLSMESALIICNVCALK